MTNFTAPPFRLPRLLLLDAEPRMAANVTLALGAWCLPFGFAELYRDAVRGLLGEQGEMALRPENDEFVTLGTKTFLRRNLEQNVRDQIEAIHGGPFATAMLMDHRIRNELPYFACIAIEDAIQPNWDAATELCGHLLAISALEPKEIYWLTITNGIKLARPVPLGVRSGAIPASQLTSNAEILSAMEMLG